MKATTKNISLLQAEPEPDEEQGRDDHLGNGMRHHQPRLEHAVDEARGRDRRTRHHAEHHSDDDPSPAAMAVKAS